MNGFCQPAAEARAVAAAAGEGGDCRPRMSATNARIGDGVFAKGSRYVCGWISLRDLLLPRLVSGRCRSTDFETDSRTRTDFAKPRRRRETVLFAGGLGGKTEMDDGIMQP
jgi:hypothetical protein